MKRYEQNIIIDLEFTITPKELRKQGLHCEIIQIGAVRVDNAGAILDSFSTYVRPEFATRIANYITNLTGIKGFNVVEAEPFAKCLDEFSNWVGNVPTRMVAWSGSDKIQMTSEASFKNFKLPHWRWFDLQKVYPRVMSLSTNRLISLRTAADWLGIKVSADQLHGALYDASLTAELFSSLLTGDYKEQKRALSNCLCNPESAKPLTNTLESKFANLKELLFSQCPETPLAAQPLC